MRYFLVLLEIYVNMHKLLHFYLLLCCQNSYISRGYIGTSRDYVWGYLMIVLFLVELNCHLQSSSLVAVLFSSTIMKRDVLNFLSDFAIN